MLPEKILIAARKKRGLSQAEVAKSLGEKLKQTYSPRQYQRIEDGKFPKYKTDVVKALEEILNVKIYDLIYDNIDTTLPIPGMEDLVDHDVTIVSELKKRIAFLEENIKSLDRDKEDLREEKAFIHKTYGEKLDLLQEALKKSETNLNEVQVNQGLIIDILRDAVVRAAQYRFGTDKKGLANELHEINKVLGAALK